MEEFEMVQVDGGSFEMGSSVPGDYAAPQHTVFVDSFLLGTHPVTQKEYKKVTGTNPAKFRVYRHPAEAKAYLSQNDVGSIDFNHPVLALEPRPVENVNWFEAVVFCNLLSIQTGLKPCYTIRNSVFPENWGRIPVSSPAHDSEVSNYFQWNKVSCDFHADGYRLPTEAEWEYAARGGARSRGYLFAGGNVLAEVGCHQEAVAYTEQIQTAPVASFAPNELGLYDMSGNVWEWCWDWIGRYSGEEQSNPHGPVQGQDRVARGGCYSGKESWCRVFFRGGNVPEFKANSTFGFRLCRSVV